MTWFPALLRRLSADQTVYYHSLDAISPLFSDYAVFLRESAGQGASAAWAALRSISPSAPNRLVVRTIFITYLLPVDGVPAFGPPREMKGESWRLMRRRLYSGCSMKSSTRG